MPIAVCTPRVGLCKLVLVVAIVAGGPIDVGGVALPDAVAAASDK